MKAHLLLLITLLTGTTAFAVDETQPIPVNKYNLKCEITEHQNYDGVVYWGHATYRLDNQDKYTVFLEGSETDPAPVERACGIVGDVLERAESNNGMIDAVFSERQFVSNCYQETTGGVYAPRPTGNSYRILRTTKTIFFSSALSVHKSEYSEKRYIGSTTCAE